MKQALLVIVILSFFGILLSGGFTTRDPKRLLSSSQATQVVPASVNPSAQDNLQLTNQIIVSPSPHPSPSIPTGSTGGGSNPGPDCGGDASRTGGCSCKPQPIESEAVVCNNAIDDNPSAGTLGGVTWTADQTCPDAGIPCSTWEYHNSYGVYDSWSCGPHSCVYIKNIVNNPANPLDYYPDAANPNYDKYATDCNGTGAPNPVCFAKPVIYLYPLADTFVNVNLDIPGVITKSIPEYNQGWNRVLAHPGGNIDYQGKRYSELFYESQVDHTKSPKEGIIIPKSQLEPRLSEILSKLGLKNNEKQEFLAYWLPELLKTNGDYIIFSLVDPVEKERVDHVKISPEPDTRIEFLAYFKPVYFPIAIPELKLPDNPPVRVGFTEVEWGGTIDY